MNDLTSHHKSRQVVGHGGQTAAGPSSAVAPMVRGTRAFTLLELLVVLVILAVLTTVAVRSLDTIQGQARYDGTIQGLDNMEAAVLGAANEREADGSLLVTGFVADIGRLPHAVGGDPTTQLQELWNQPAGLLPFAVRTAPDDPGVLLGTGWRGNYLRLGVGRTSLTDGWGRAYDLLWADGVTPCANGDEVDIVRSRGADGLVDNGSTTGYDADVILNLSATAPSSDTRYAATVGGRVYQLDNASGQLEDPNPANGSVVVCYFGPNPNTGGVLETEATMTTSPTGTAVTYSVPATVATTGPRVLRAYQIPMGTPTTLANLGLATLKSVPVRITLQAGGQVRDLVLLH